MLDDPALNPNRRRYGTRPKIRNVHRSRHASRRTFPKSADISAGIKIDAEVQETRTVIARERTELTA